MFHKVVTVPVQIEGPARTSGAFLLGQSGWRPLLFFRHYKQQNIQMELNFSSALTGAARGGAGEETESLMATKEPENPARTNRLMEEVCERENLKEALRQVKGNKCSA